MKSPNFLAIFKNMLAQRLLVESIEYMSLHLILTWSTHDICLISSETTFSTCSYRMLLTTWLQNGIEIPQIYGSLSFFQDLLSSTTFDMRCAPSNEECIAVLLITFSGKHINKINFTLNSTDIFILYFHYKYP